jgi:predicted anti-sigma-YlaC factor YlaD
LLVWISGIPLVKNITAANLKEWWNRVKMYLLWATCGTVVFICNSYCSIHNLGLIYTHLLSFIWRHTSNVNQTRDDSTSWMP